ncbi:carboxypeptidase-like regulatory domain-containing protein [Runella sp. CRIBMP]|uniref:TonB-dependent receptor n=1 Tax=Runella sp. CRIBMP TaxID=2683261 RepID=UPI001E389917|nr:carboxypeptidase-like regulatory domain-containing protein [Runella sp. CRIBMP]
MSINIVIAQSSQVVTGVVTDKITSLPIQFAYVSVLNSQPFIGAFTDSLGAFLLPIVPTGRYDIEVSFIGYHKRVIREVLVVSGKQTQLDIDLEESLTQLDEVVIRPTLNKQKSLNPFATVSARMLSVEEASRYAGGFDDPARLASAFAGVASNNSNNGIVVRGNAPRYLQWRMEGVEIPSPNHFNDLRSFGGGTLTALSTQMLANSDFLTGAFPAEYTNALSGVFDMNLRKGNTEKTERTIQLGLIGLESSQEGPFKKGGKSSYVFNYRYSTLGLLGPVLPDGASTIKYQDLSFKLNFLTKKAGVFSVWGLGLIDGAQNNPKKDSTDRKYYDDSQEDRIRMRTGAFGINHKIFLRNNAYLQTVLSATANETDWQTKALNQSEQLVPFSNISNTNWEYALSSYVNKKFGARHTNRTGVRVRFLNYDLKLNRAANVGGDPAEIVKARGRSVLSSAFTNSSIFLTSGLRLNIGVSAQHFSLNNNYSIEPRMAITQNIGEKHTLGLAYGLHSRMERLYMYYNNSLSTGEKAVNKNMGFTKAHHFVLSYDWNITDIIHLKVEPYFQQLYNVPVMEGTSLSAVNFQSDWFFAEKMVNKGEGRNYGLDITLEKYMSNGFYYMATTSIFESKYKGGDGVWRDSRFNRNYVVNLLAGKEWKVGKNQQNTFNINGRITFQGGDRFSPINEQATKARKTIVYDETRAYSVQSDPITNVHLTLVYRKNKLRSSREIALKIVNLTQQPDFFGYQYNFRTGGIDKDIETILLPNLSYKIFF